MDNDQETATMINVVGNDLTVTDIDGDNKTGIISRQTYFNLPYGTRIKFRDVNCDFVIGTEEKKKECGEYYNFKGKKCVKNIIIELPKESDILWIDNANPMDMHHEVLSENKKFILTNGTFILSQNTPIMTEKIFMVLSKDTIATY